MATTPAVTALDSIEAILDSFDAAGVGRGERLVCASRSRGLASRLTAVAALLVARAEAGRESEQRSGTPATSWLALQPGWSKREAAGLLHQGRDLAEHPGVADAAVSGRISVNQARAIHTAMAGLDGLDAPGQAKAENMLLELAGSMDSDRLVKAAPQVLARVAPERAAETLERRLQRQAEAAQANRSLVFSRDNNGSVKFSGSLPLPDGQAWITLLDAYTESQRRTAVEERDPLAAGISPQQRRADAMVAMIQAHQQQRRAPKVAGDRPRIVVTLNYDTLLRGAAAAGLIGADEPISAGDLRRLCCDADLLPAVLGGPSDILDVGRDHRLVTPPIRAALTLRDRGCIFPGCHARACNCDAHHVVPWHQGGPTALSNLCLLCHHHHTLLEPARYPTRDQWEIRIAHDGIPEVIPPARYDPHRRPIRHARFHTNEPASQA